MFTTFEADACEQLKVLSANLTRYLKQMFWHSLTEVVFTFMVWSTKQRNLFKFLNRLIHVCTSFHNSITTKLWKMPVDCSTRPHISLKHIQNISDELVSCLCERSLELTMSQHKNKCLNFCLFFHCLYHHFGAISAELLKKNQRFNQNVLTWASVRICCKKTDHIRKKYIVCIV